MVWGFEPLVLVHGTRPLNPNLWFRSTPRQNVHYSGPYGLIPSALRRVLQGTLGVYFLRPKVPCLGLLLG